MALRIDILTLFPEMFPPILGTSIPKRAAEKGLVSYHLTNIRDFATDAHKSVDDKPFGGGVVGWNGAGLGWADRVVRAIGSTLIFPGAMHLLSIAIVTDLLVPAFGYAPFARAALLMVWAVAFVGHGALAVRRNFAALRQLDTLPAVKQ